MSIAIEIGLEAYLTRNHRNTAKNFLAEAPNGQLRVGSIESKDLEHYYTGRTISPKPSSTFDNGRRNVDATSAPAPKSTPSFSTPAQCLEANMLTLTVTDGIIKDGKHRTGYIASNHQFQFDDPPQSGALFTAGYSICDDGLIALGSSATWFRCPSGNFFNVYDEKWADHCEQIHLQAVQIFDCSVPSGSLAVYGPTTSVLPTSTATKATTKASTKTLPLVADPAKTLVTSTMSKANTTSALAKGTSKTS